MTKAYSKVYTIDNYTFSIIADNKIFFDFLKNYKKIFHISRRKEISSSFYIFNENKRLIEYIKRLYPNYRNIICSNKEYRFSDKDTFVWNIPKWKYFALIDTSRLPSRAFPYCKKIKNYNHLFWYFEPIFLSLLSRCGLFLIHATAIAKDGRGILFPAEAGCGKTTVAISLILSGFKIISDDLVFLRSNERNFWAVSSFENVSVTEQTINLFDKLKFLKKKPSVKVGPFYKWFVDIDKLKPGAKIKKASLRVIIFPYIRPHKETKIEPVSKKEAYLKLLSQNNWDGHSDLDDNVALRKKFEFYRNLVDTVECFNLCLGKDINRLPRFICNILK